MTADAADLLAIVTALPPEHVALVVAGLTDDERVQLWKQMEENASNPYFRYRHNPLGFVTEGLKEATWSGQREVLAALPLHRKVVVAASHSVGKSFIASRAAGAVALSWPADMVKVQTTASNFRQVKGILWPYIARMHSKYQLPGETFTTSWRIGTEEVGEGFSARNTDEAAVSGFHAMGELLLVIDEGGGIHRTLGNAFNNVLTGNGHALVIGNFPTDDDETWFNEIWSSSEWHQIRISAFATPNFPKPYGRELTSLAEVERWLAIAETQPDHPGLVGAFEQVGTCTICSPMVGQHTIAKHLTDIEWVRSVAAEFGEESGYYQTRVLALPAKNIISKTLPIAWLEACIAEAQHTPEVVGPKKVGIDVAVDGGDELAIAVMTGWRVRIAHHSSGADNQNSVDVAERCLRYILECEVYHAEHKLTERVRVKIDENGIGRGVSDLLKRWGKEDRHNAVIVGVNSARRAHKPEKFKNQRSEMWWTVRELIQPALGGDEPPVLQIDTTGGNRLKAQLNAPKWEGTSGGQIVVQDKAGVKTDTGHSPDQGEAVLLAVYEPPVPRSEHGALLLGQANPWGAVT